MVLFKQNKEKLISEYSELILAIPNDNETLTTIQNITHYIEENHVEDFNPEFIQKRGILMTALYYSKRNQEHCRQQLKFAKEEQRQKLCDTLFSYNLYVTELQQIILEEHAIMYRQNQRKKLEKILTPEEIEKAKRECLSRGEERTR